MIKFGVIVLNYLAYKCTIDCVDGFLKQKRSNDYLKIVIVDNDSQNESYTYLCDYYRSNQNVVVCKTSSNLGFAKGNNYGYSVLKTHSDFDFVIISNDDILLSDSNIFEWIESTYSKQAFGVLGPDVYSKRFCYHQSPLPSLPSDKKECKKFINSLKRKRLFLWFRSWLKLVGRYSPNTIQSHGAKDSEKYKKVSFGSTLHGSFLVFHQSYFINYDEPFDPRTFLYCEEDILRLRCFKKNIPGLYCPTYQVLHLQDTSSFENGKKNYFKEYKRIGFQITSIKIYYSILNEGETE